MNLNSWCSQKGNSYPLKEVWINKSPPIGLRVWIWCNKQKIFSISFNYNNKVEEKLEALIVPQV